MTVPTRLPEADVAGVRTAIGQFRASRHRRGVIALAAAPCGLVPTLSSSTAKA